MDGGWRQGWEIGREREGESSMLRGEGGNGGERNSSHRFYYANIYAGRTFLKSKERATADKILPRHP